MFDTQTASQAHREYEESRILSAHSVEIVGMLYQLATDSLTTALSCLKNGDIFARGRAVSKAQEAVTELALALDHSAGAVFSRTLAELYTYVRQQMIKGHTQKSEQALRDALSILTTLAEGWAGVRANLRAGRRLTSAEPTNVVEPESETSSVSGINSVYSEYGQIRALPADCRDWSC